MTKLHFAPNTRYKLAIVDPQGEYDADLRQGTYQTTAGQIFTLPRPAVIALNELDPRPGEEIQIEKRWSGKAGEGAYYEISRPGTRPAPRSAPASPPPTYREHQRPVTPIRRPNSQPGLFDNRSTGTYGFVVSPALRPRLMPPIPTSGQIPANVAIKEILVFLDADPIAGQWSPDAKATLARNIFEGAVKAGQIGLWERRER